MQVQRVLNVILLKCNHLNHKLVIIIIIIINNIITSYITICLHLPNMYLSIYNLNLRYISVYKAYIVRCN